VSIDVFVLVSVCVCGCMGMRVFERENESERERERERLCLSMYPCRMLHGCVWRGVGLNNIRKVSGPGWVLGQISRYERWGARNRLETPFWCLVPDCDFYLIMLCHFNWPIDAIS
jgi:hypothetical protein